MILLVAIPNMDAREGVHQNHYNRVGDANSINTLIRERERKRES